MLISVAIALVFSFTVKTRVLSNTLTRVLENTYSFWGVPIHLVVLEYTLPLKSVLCNTFRVLAMGTHI